MRYYLGIDGGGTKTDFLLVDERGKVLARHGEKGSNPNDIGIEGAYQVFYDGLQAVCKGAGITPDQITLFCGGSGCGVGSYSKQLTDRFQKIVERAGFASDVSNAAELGLSSEDGVVAIAGTGSAFAVQRQGQIQIVGGNGYLFEDYGSGYAVARAGFQACLDEADGFGRATLLKTLYEEKLQGEVKKSLGSLYKGGKALIASFAPLVFEGAERGDDEAKRILEKNQAYITRSLNELTKRYALKRVALVGGIFKNQAFAQGIKENLNEDVSVRVPVLPPVCGAVRRAVKLYGDCDVAFTEALEKILQDKEE